jgi:hypothetical protein
MSRLARAVESFMLKVMDWRVFFWFSLIEVLNEKVCLDTINLCQRGTQLILNVSVGLIT